MFRSAVILFAAMGILTACSKGFQIKNEAAKSVEILPSQHKPDECPIINGEFFQKDSDVKKIVKTTVSKNGVNFVDSASDWVINGKVSIVEGSNEKLSYMGTCSQNQIILDLYEDTNHLGQMIYTLDNKDQLIVQTLSDDPGLSAAGKEIWSPRTIPAVP